MKIQCGTLRQKSVIIYHSKNFSRCNFPVPKIFTIKFPGMKYLYRAKFFAVLVCQYYYWVGGGGQRPPIRSTSKSDVAGSIVGDPFRIN